MATLMSENLRHGCSVILVSWHQAVLSSSFKRSHFGRALVQNRLMFRTPPCDNISKGTNSFMRTREVQVAWLIKAWIINHSLIISVCERQPFYRAKINKMQGLHEIIFWIIAAMGWTVLLPQFFWHVLQIRQASLILSCASFTRRPSFLSAAGEFICIKFTQPVHHIKPWCKILL